MIADQRWAELLSEWMAEGTSLWLKNQSQWAALGLPLPETLQVIAPDHSGATQLRGRFVALADAEVVGFYLATDGWPLWLGASWISLSPVSRVGLFRSTYPDAFDIAISAAPAERKAQAHSVSLSRQEIRDSIVLSEPDARELVLSLPSGETCLYLFDSMTVFPNLFEFMVYQKRSALKWVREMLSPGEE